ncbi:MAG TPA: hypothetical protein VGF22_02425 [Acidimicrobiales bacterium]|jgi:hypothetical protein
MRVLTERQPHAYESWVIGACISVVAIVIAVCLVVLALAGMLYGVAYMKAHWP